MSIHPRHDVLFEILRRQNMADRTCHRLLSAEDQARIDAEAAEELQALAIASFDSPPEPDVALASAPKAGRDHEFFRAVSA